MAVAGYYGPNVVTTMNMPNGGGRPGGGSATAGIGQAYQSSGQSMNEWIQEALGPTGDVRDVPGVETVDYTGVAPIDDVITEEVTPDPVLSDKDKVWNYASMEAGDPFDPENRYVKSWEGQQFKERMKKEGITEKDPQWKSEFIYQFGMPSIVATQGRKYGEPIKTTFGDDYIYTGLGRALLDEGVTSEGYEQAKDKYWIETRPEQDLLAGRGDNNYSYDYSYDPGSYTVSGGYGYGVGGDPNVIGRTPFDYGNPYSEARYAPLEQHKRMVDVNSPMYAARGGIMNLRR